MDNNKLVLFGAGKIGRSFIAQLFSRGGFEVVFIDIDHRLINELNHQRNYNVVIKGGNNNIINIRNVRAVHANDVEKVINEISSSTIMSVSVGINGLQHILPLIAKGLMERYSKGNKLALDIIIAENMRNASEYLYQGLKKHLPENYPIDQLVGLVETSIGKMVPIMPKKEVQKDILQVYAEPYNTLILDKKAFKNPIPSLEGLAPKENMKAWVDRKAFIHNLGHAAAAYYGYYKCPDKKYLYEVLDDDDVLSFTVEVMKQSAKALNIEYPEEFTISDLHIHIDDLISRFRNKALGDTVYRIGMDLNRKLSKNDRIIGAIRLAQKHNCWFDKILETLIFGLLFRATDEFGKTFPGDQDLVILAEKNLASTLNNVCGFNSIGDIHIINTIENMLYSKSIKPFL